MLVAGCIGGAFNGIGILNSTFAEPGNERYEAEGKKVSGRPPDIPSTEANPSISSSLSSRLDTAPLSFQLSSASVGC